MQPCPDDSMWCGLPLVALAGSGEHVLFEDESTAHQMLSPLDDNAVCPPGGCSLVINRGARSSSLQQHDFSRQWGTTGL
jgi:hypothetical protein